MAEQTSLNYTELKKIAKTFDDESDALTELLGKTRQMVHELKDDWIGEGGEHFFDEMETEILPAMERLNQALSFTADTVRKITKTFDDAEFETVEFFSDGRLERSNAGAELGGLDFGIKDLGSVPIGTGGSSSGIDVGDLDFGIGGTVDTPAPAPTETSPGIDVSGLEFGIGDGSGSAPSSGIDVGGLDFGKEALGDVPVDAGGGSTPGASETSPATPGDATSEKAETTTESSAAETSSGGGGGGGGSGGSEGMKGDLNGMGTGASNQTTSGGQAGGSTSEPLPDHVYQSKTESATGGGSTAAPAGATASTAAGNSPQPTIRTSGGDAAGSDSNNLAGVVGALGGIGAAAGGVAKVVKDKKDSE